MRTETKINAANSEMNWEKTRQNKEGKERDLD